MSSPDSNGEKSPTTVPATGNFRKRFRLPAHRRQPFSSQTDRHLRHARHHPPQLFARGQPRHRHHTAAASRHPAPQLKSVEKVNDMPFEDYTKVVRFENLTTIDPIEKFQLETSPDLIETRVIDLVTPIGAKVRAAASSSRRRVQAKRPSSSRFATPSPRIIRKFMRSCCSLMSGPRKSRISNAR